jgi:(p)ppGpp synthase/HD superfamily hydrolase
MNNKGSLSQFQHDKDCLNILQHFMQKIKTESTKQNIDIDVGLIEDAINYVQKYHKNQIRHSGEPYFYHLFAVANITMDYLFDTESIVAAILHDVVEDTNSCIEQIELIFNKEIAEIVHVLSKITAHYKLSKEETFYKINNSQDTKQKAIIIKIIDRLHNIRTIHHIKSITKQKRIASETLQFYIPLAKAVNLVDIEKELNDSVVRILNLQPTL